LGQGLTMQPRLTSSFWFSCPSFLSTGIIGIHHHAHLPCPFDWLRSSPPLCLCRDGHLVVDKVAFSVSDPSRWERVYRPMLTKTWSYLPRPHPLKASCIIKHILLSMQLWVISQMQNWVKEAGSQEIHMVWFIYVNYKPKPKQPPCYQLADCDQHERLSGVIVMLYLLTGCCLHKSVQLVKIHHGAYLW
jgi:hypothetical protein